MQLCINCQSEKLAQTISLLITDHANTYGLVLIHVPYLFHYREHMHIKIWTYIFLRKENKAPSGNYKLVPPNRKE